MKKNKAWPPCAVDVVHFFHLLTHHSIAEDIIAETKARRLLCYFFVCRSRRSRNSGMAIEQGI